MKPYVSLNSESPEIKAKRQQLEKDVKAFKKAGGKIQQIPFSKSANKVFEFVIHTGDA